jgi:3-isopropylmalate/(R)-2-methylmalate dehydratase small subunit
LHLQAQAIALPAACFWNRCLEPFTRLSTNAAALPAANIDTDVIMPKQFLKGIDRAGLARGLFHDARFDANGAPRPDFVLNQAVDIGALLTGPNFGCGSSREHAVWGLLQFGIRAVIGSSFAGIFADNALNNGLLLIRLAPEVLEPLHRKAQDRPTPITIDLEAQRITMEDIDIAFAIEPAARTALLRGLDRIGTTLLETDRIRAFEQSYLAARPWLTELSQRGA